MTPEQLSALQNLPEENTGPSIRAALAKIASAKTSALSRIADAEAEMREKQATVTLDSAKRRKLADTIADQNLDIEMLDALAARITEPLAEIEDAERRKELGEEGARLLDEMEAHGRKWAAEYPRLAAELAELTAEREDFARRARAHGWAKGFHLPGIEKFEQRTREGRLPLSAEQLEANRVAEFRAIREATEARNAAAASRATTHESAPPRPVLTIGGVRQDMPGAGW